MHLIDYKITNGVETIHYPWKILDGSPGVVAYYNATEKTIVFPNSHRVTPFLLLTLLHEVRHAIQDIKGWDLGDRSKDERIRRFIERDAVLWAASNYRYASENIKKECVEEYVSYYEYSIGRVSRE